MFARGETLSAQIFSLERDWSKYVSDRGGYSRIFPNFQYCALSEKDWKDDKHDSLHLGRKYARMSAHTSAPNGGVCLYRNTSGSLRDREILWEHELSVFHSFLALFRVLPNFHSCFYLSIRL